MRSERNVSYQSVAFVSILFHLTNFYSLLNKIDTNAINGKAFEEVTKYLVYRKKNRGSVTKIANRLGNPEPTGHDWLKLTPKDKLPQPDKLAYPKPPKAADGSLIYERIPNKGEIEVVKEEAAPVSLKRRPTDELNGVADNGEGKIIFFLLCVFFSKKSARLILSEYIFY